MRQTLGDPLKRRQKTRVGREIEGRSAEEDIFQQSVLLILCKGYVNFRRDVIYWRARRRFCSDSFCFSPSSALEGEAWLEGSRTAGRVAIDQGLRDDGVESRNEREGKDQRERGPSGPSYCAYSIGKPPSPETLLVAISSERGFQRESCPKALRRKMWKTNSRLFSSQLHITSLFNRFATDPRIIRGELDNIDMTFSWDLRPYQGRRGVGRISISCASWSRTPRHLCIIIIIRFYGGDI